MQVSIRAMLALLAGACIGTQAAAVINPGMSLLRTEHYSSALAYFKAQLQSNPKDAVATADMAKLYLAQGKFEAGVTWAKKATALAPNNADYQLLLGNANSYYVHKVSIFHKLGIAHAIHAAYQKAVDLAPHNAKARLSLASYYIMAPGIAGGSTSKANQQITVLDKINPVMADAARARRALTNKNVKKAEGFLREAAKTDTSGNSDFDLGLLLMSRKLYPEAIGVFEDGIRKAPANSNNYYQVGHVAVLGKIHVQEGIRDLKQYLSMPHSWDPETPTYKWAHYRLGMLYGIAGDKADEKAQYQAALKLDPKFKQAAKALGNM